MLGRVGGARIEYSKVKLSGSVAMKVNVVDPMAKSSWTLIVCEAEAKQGHKGQDTVHIESDEGNVPGEKYKEKLNYVFMHTHTTKITIL